MIFNFLIAAFPSVILSMIYFFLFASAGEVEFVSSGKKISELFEGRYLISFIRDVEKPWTIMLAWSIYFLFIAGIIFKLVVYGKEKDENRIREVHWLSGIFLILFMVVPESMASGEFITARMELMIFIFVSIGAGYILIQLGKFSRLLIVSLLFLNAMVIYKKWPSIRQEAHVAGEFYLAGKTIPAHSVVLPLHNSTDWFVRHFDNYLGIEKPVLILDNYEADRKYFPVLWNERSDPGKTLGDFVGPEVCAYPAKYEKASATEITFVSYWHRQESDSCAITFDEYLKINYEEVYREGDMLLFKKLILQK